MGDPIKVLTEDAIRDWFLFMKGNNVAWCDMYRVSHDNGLPGPGTILEQIPWLLRENRELRARVEELQRNRIDIESPSDARTWD